MRRREFIRLIGSSAVGWPLAALAQQPSDLKRIGVLISGTASDLQVQRQVEALRAGLRDLGWVEGRNVVIDVRFPADDPDRMRTFAAELVKLNPNVLLASGPTPVFALEHLNQAIPIVFTQMNDPVGAGAVASLAKPGGNLTGFTPGEFSLGGKFLEVLKEMIPTTNEVGVLLDPKLTDQSGIWHVMQEAASSAAVSPRELSVRDATSIERAIDEFATKSNASLIVLANRTTISNRKLIIALAAKYRLPALYSYRYFVDEGGLVSYGADLIDVYRRSAGYVDKILRGEKPANLPVQQPTKYELTINLRTAKSLGLTIPQSLIATADEVIE